MGSTRGRDYDYDYIWLNNVCAPPRSLAPCAMTPTPSEIPPEGVALAGIRGPHWRSEREKLQIQQWHQTRSSNNSVNSFSKSKAYFSRFTGALWTRFRCVVVEEIWVEIL